MRQIVEGKKSDFTLVEQ